MTDRADYIAGLRALADLLEGRDDLPLPDTGTMRPFDWWIFPSNADDPKATLATLVRLIPGTKNKTVGEGTGASWFTVEAALHGLRIDINTYREAVCRRVVTGTREVTKQVADPEALAAVPTTTVTETEDIVEWVCEPILAEATS